MHITVWQTRGVHHLQVSEEPPPHENAYPLNIMACRREIRTGDSLSGPREEVMDWLRGVGAKLCKKCFPQEEA